MFILTASLQRKAVSPVQELQGYIDYALAGVPVLRGLAPTPSHVTDSTTQETREILSDRHAVTGRV